MGSTGIVRHDHVGDPRFPLGFAHRGGRHPAGENTIAAFQAALDAGVRGLESDVWLTSDGIPVLDHDGKVGPDKTPIASAARADLPSHIPTLAELYRACGTDFELSLDVKDLAGLDLVVEQARRVGASGRLWLVAGWPDLAGWRDRLGDDAHVVAGVLLSRAADGFDDVVAAAHDAGCCAINMRDDRWTRRRIAATHRAGLAAFGWNAHTWPQLWRLRRLGADAVYADPVRRLIAAVPPRPSPPSGSQR